MIGLKYLKRYGDSTNEIVDVIILDWMEILENNSEISCVINEKIKRVWERGANRVPLNFDFVFAKTFIYIYIFRLFWCTGIKNNFLKIKKILF